MRTSSETVCFESPVCFEIEAREIGPQWMIDCIVMQSETCRENEWDWAGSI